MQMKTRSEIVDISRGALIILVTLGHIIQFITIGMGEKSFLKIDCFLLYIHFICLHS